MVQLLPKQERVFGWNFRIKNSQCFQIFLDKLSQEYPEHLNVVQLDNGKFHQSYQLKIAHNILLIFQPPYSPELNPIERIWQQIKQELSWGIYENLDEIKEKVRAFLNNCSHHTIASITGWDYIRSALATIAGFWRNGITYNQKGKNSLSLKNRSRKMPGGVTTSPKPRTRKD